MEVLNDIAINLWAFIRENSIELPLNLNVNITQTSQLLKTWQPNFSLPESDGFWNPQQTISYSRLRAMIQDQSEPEMIVGFFVEDEKIYSTKFGRMPSERSILLDSLIIQRYPIRVIPVPGEGISEEFPRVILYDDIGDGIKLNTIIDGYGIYQDNEFHMVKLKDPEPTLTVSNLKTEIIYGISQSLGGDNLTAELVMYNLLSKVQERGTLIGNLPLNITNIPNPQNFYTTISTLTRMIRLPLTISSLSSADLTPTKNYDEDKLEYSPLQIPDGSLLILDETGLHPGQLNDKGIKNIQTLTQLIERQKVSYDFKYYQTDFLTDINILVVSVGRSLFKIPLFLKLREERPSEVHTFTRNHSNYLKGCAKLEISMSEDVIKTAQEYFVSQRQISNITEEDLHLLLTLTRYNAQSELANVANITHWEYAKALVSRIKSSQT